MINMDRPYNRPIVAPIVSPIVPTIQIKHVHSSVSYQRATYQRYDRHGPESPSGYGPLVYNKRSSLGIGIHRLIAQSSILSENLIIEV